MTANKNVAQSKNVAQNVRFRHAWNGGTWLSDVEIEIGEDGLIKRVGSFQGDDVDCLDIALPGIPNVHSHAFQWTFAGQSELRTAENDSFWTWREQMYHSVASLDPDSYYESACELFRMMLQCGYTSVGEFHYIHNQADGSLYPELAEMSHRVIQAAVDTGIAITMLPVLYQRGGFDDRPLKGTQKRFELTDSQFMNLSQAIVERWSGHRLVQNGMAIHSLRAVDPAKLATVVERFREYVPEGPVHIHVAEQIPEVEDCLKQFGKRPVELLFDSVEVDDRWCLIHATHLSDSELERLANSDSVVGICPTTEANLGDGVFRAGDFFNRNGFASIGSDSHVALNPFAELRLLEYGQRLTSHSRAILCSENDSCGRFLLQKVLDGGNRIMGPIPIGKIAVGYRADLLELDRSHPAIRDVDPEQILDRMIFCQWPSRPVVKRAMVAGNWVGG